MHLRSHIMDSTIRQFSGDTISQFCNSLAKKNKKCMEQYMVWWNNLQVFFLTHTTVLHGWVYLCHYYFSFFITLLNLSFLFVIGKRYTRNHVQKLMYSAARSQTLNCSLGNMQASLFVVLIDPLSPKLALKPQVFLQCIFGTGMCYHTVT